MRQPANPANAGTVLAVHGSATGCSGIAKARKHTELVQARR
jgi:hypothetical protein